MTFESLGLHPFVLKALNEAGYTKPTTVQEQAIPAAIAGRDLLVSSQTGSGKTAAFTLPLLQRMLKHENASTSHAEYSCWDADRGCRWTVLINVPETGSWLAAPVTSVNSLFAGDVPSPLRPLCSKPVFDWLVLVHPAPENPNTLLMGLATAGKPVPLPQTLLRKLALELDSSPPHETH